MKKLVSYVFLWTAVVTFMLGGCQSMTDEVPTSSLQEHYYFVKKVEHRTLSMESVVTNEIPDVWQGKISDYFGILDALEAYNIGRTITREAAFSRSVASLPAYSETNIVQQAFKDGIDDGAVKDVNVLRRRDQSRRRLQEKFWGCGVASEEDDPEACATTDGGVATNYYSELAASYTSGYKNGWCVVNRLKKSPISTVIGCGGPYLGPDAMRRAYVYGWYSACHDYFVSHGDEVHYVDQSGCIVQVGLDSVDYYRMKVDRFKEREFEFLLFCARQRQGFYSQLWQLLFVYRK